jgi:predicted ATPase/DNA-binding winged helix-turn-helix (wHTH) protein
MIGEDSTIVCFGPFRLSPATRTIEKNNLPLSLGHRALDILIVLVERPGEIVSHKELISRVWRGLVVSPSSLRVHMTGLRKALGESTRGARYIANVVGQGYSFVAPISREAAQPAQNSGYPCDVARQGLALPPKLARIVGREDSIRTVSADLLIDRFVTIIGPGGMGKTTVAVSVAHALLEEFAGAVCFIDISAVTDAKLVAATIASTLGLTVQSQDVLPSLMQCLRSLRILLVLDNCEHVIDAIAALAEQIYMDAPGVHILATSREALRVEGEHAYWLPPLSSPSPDAAIKADAARIFPAIRLFMERACASGSRFELTDANLSTVIGICTRLDGIALAIELAASRVATHGLAATADLVNTHLGLHWKGRRTAPPRHQTLHGLIDWSYCALAESERRVLRELSILVGSFTLAAAQAIACETNSVPGAVDALVSKSLLSSVNSDDGVTRYRLLETTRAYALEKLEESGERREISQRHARYFASLLGHSDDAHTPRVVTLTEHLGNIRVALEWCFDTAESLLAIDLAAAAVPMFLELSLLSECHRWSTAALQVLDVTTRGSRQELVLQEALAISSTWTLGSSHSVRAAISRALEIADKLGETSIRPRLLVGMHVSLQRMGDFPGSLTIAQQLQAEPRQAEDVSYEILADWMRGSSEHFLGDQKAARLCFEHGFSRAGPRNLEVFGLDYRVRALVTFARVMWLNGSPDRAMKIAKEANTEAATLGKPLNVCFSLLYTASVFLWCGELRAAREVLGKLLRHPNFHALPSFHATAHALNAELRIRAGDIETGVGSLRCASNEMKVGRQSILSARAACVLARGLTSLGQHEDALRAIGNAIADATEGSETVELPELLRTQAEILLSKPGADDSAAEALLARALALARRQSALAWELRIAITFARLWVKRDRSGEAHELLAGVYDRFTDGFQTEDLRSAQRILKESGIVIHQ